MNRTYYKVGIDDTGKKNVIHKGKQIAWMSPYLNRWKAMIARCYSEREPTKFPKYRGITVCPEWLYLSNFEKWMMAQDWEGNELDKDFLSYGEKVYSPETCAFIPKRMNYYLGDCIERRGQFALGVTYQADRKRFASYVRKAGRSVGLGRFKSEIEAHNAYQKAKLEIGREMYFELIGSTDARAMRSFDNILNKLQSDIESGSETLSLHPNTFPSEWKLEMPVTATPDQTDQNPIVRTLQ